MKIIDFLEIFFVVTAGIAMPFIVIGSYFNFVPKGERDKPLTFFFLIISIIYALTYSYFSWKSVQETKSWQRIVEKKDPDQGKKGK